jgi:hypothetical protein
MYNNLGAPSVYAHILSGVFVFTALLFVIWNITKLQGVDVYKKMIMLLLISISIGVHGLSHLGIEQTYHYYPVQTMCPMYNKPCPMQNGMCRKRVRFAV